MADCHVIGTDVIVQGTFENSTGALTTPSAYTLTYADPAGNTATITQGSIDNPSTGVLEAAIPADETGVWRYAWTVTIGSENTVIRGVFCVVGDGVS